MSLMKLIVEGIIFYFIYKFIFELVIPISKAASQMKGKVKEMQEAQQRFYEQQQSSQQQEPESNQSQPPSEGDYIDFEEVK